MFYGKSKSSVSLVIGVFLLSALSAVNVEAASTASIVSALRIAGSVTGGLMPQSDPLFASMIASIEAGDYRGAAVTAANSSYAANYLARRMAFQMQNPGLEALGVTDSDATAFLIAHFSSVNPSLSTILSENSTYLVTVTRTVAGVTAPVQVHAADLTQTELSTIDWRTALVQVAGQNAFDTVSKAKVAIPAKHVGGYITLSDRAGDNSFSQYGFTAGTNLRMIKAIWEISSGLTVTDFVTADAIPQIVPRFVPEYDPNFFRGQGQPACISCHGGGLVSLSHGYSTLADVFDFDATNGLTYIAAPTTGTKKSFGSDSTKRAANSTCNLAATPMPVCNPDSQGADPNQGWDLSGVWESNGILGKLGWGSVKSGQGLNSLGIQIGQSGSFYTNMVQRVISQVCPMGSISSSEVAAMAASGKSSNDFRNIVASVASHATCR